MLNDTQHAGRGRDGSRIRQTTGRAGPASLGGMNSNMPDEAASPLASGHAPDAPASRTPLQNRVAVLTGGTGALGLALTLRFLASGAFVVVTYAVDTNRAERITPVAPA